MAVGAQIYQIVSRSGSLGFSAWFSSHALRMIFRSAGFNLGQNIRYPEFKFDSIM
jgi:hypothetical protein